MRAKLDSTLPKQRWSKPLVGAALCFSLSLVSFVTAYYYSWRVTAPGLPADRLEVYSSVANAIGFSAFGLLSLSVVLLVISIARRMKRR